MDLVIVLATCALADFGSYLQGPEYQYNTIRGTAYSDPFGKWFASEMQFNLTAICLIGFRRYSLHLVAVTVIQINSFLMTLRRKNVASHEVLTAIYGFLLVIGFWVSVVEDQYAEIMLPAGAFGSVAVILRMGPLQLNKYVLWTLLGLTLHLIRTYCDDYEWIPEVVNNDFWTVAYLVTKVIATAMGLKKRSEEIKEGQDAKLVYCVLVSYAMVGAIIFYQNFVLEWDD